MSLKKQILDVVILRKRPGERLLRLPDGFDNLAPHNLVTFKSFWEALDELTGHYVNYRKQVSPSLDSLLPEEDFRLYAVSAGIRTTCGAVELGEDQ